MIPGRVSIFIAAEALDLRRSFDGLAAVARDAYITPVRPETDIDVIQPTK